MTALRPDLALVAEQIPAVVATPLPPRNISQIGKQCPTKAPMAACSVSQPMLARVSGVKTSNGSSTRLQRLRNRPAMPRRATSSAAK